MLITGIREHFQNRFNHSGILISDNKPDISKMPFFEAYKEEVLFHAFFCSNDLTASVTADTDCSKDGDMLDLTVPTAL